MPIQIISGFPQYFEIGHSTSKVVGTLATAGAPYLDIDLMNDATGDAIEIDAPNVHLLTVVRDGATLINDMGYTIIAPNVIRITPSLLSGEAIEFKKINAIAPVGNIPVTPPAPGSISIQTTKTFAVNWTDGSSSDISTYAAFVVAGKSRVRTHFTFLPEEIEVFINGQYIAPNMQNSIGGLIWQVIDGDTIELDGDYSTIKTSVQIKKTVVEGI